MIAFRTDKKTPRPANRTRGLHRKPYRRGRSDGAQIFRRGLAGLAIGNNIEGDFLPLIEATHPGALDRADMDEDILAAVIRLDEAKAFLAVEPLYRTLRHVTLLSDRVCKEAAQSRGPVMLEIWETRQSGPLVRGAAKSFGRNSIVDM